MNPKMNVKIGPALSAVPHSSVRTEGEHPGDTGDIVVAGDAGAMATDVEGEAKEGFLTAALRGRSIFGLLGMMVVLAWIVIVIIGPAISPHTNGAMVSPDVFANASRAFPLGTDYLGRDVLSRILYGARYTVGLALSAAVLASVLGTCFGLFAALSQRWIDEALSRFFDALISIPSKILALVVIAAFGSSLNMLICIAALAYVPGAYRISRSLAVNVMTLEYVQVARARGEGILYIAVREVLPNMIHPMLADFGLRFVFIVLLLSGLSFLGLGVQPPNADWGSMVRENMDGLSQGAPAVIVPALAIASLTIGVNLLIDNLRRKGGRSHGGA